MRLIKPSFEIIEQEAGLDGVYKQIEKVGRTCYKSEDKIAEGTAKPFVDRMISSKHLAMVEHGTIYLYKKVDSKAEFFEDDMLLNYWENPYSKVVRIRDNQDDPTGIQHAYITTNLRVLVENNWLDDLQYICEPAEHHVKRVTVKFICDRGVSHEFVRHRVFSFAQESTRYCNYTKDKFGNALSFIKPLWFNDSKWYCKVILKACFKGIEIVYNFLVKRGVWTPQQARAILPNSLKTELVMTGFVDDWDHFCDLRARGTTGAPHPQAKELAEPLLTEFIKRGIVSL